VSTRNSPLKERSAPLLCYVTDRRSLEAANEAQSLVALTQKIEEVAAAGIDWVQIREKDLPARDLALLVRQALDIAARVSAKRDSRIRVIVNDRLDVAIAHRADGVHLGERSLPLVEAKRMVASAVARGALEESFLVGSSCHSLEAAQTAERDGANYIVFGPVFATPSKKSFGAPQGLELLAQVCRALDIPVLAIGGVTPENGNACLQRGAAGLAAIRLFQDTENATASVQLRQRLRRFTSA